MAKSSATKTFEKHWHAITARKVVSRSNIIGIRKALNNAARWEAGWSCNKGMIDPERAAQLLSAVYRHIPAVDGQQLAFGRAYLRKPRNMRKLTDYQRDIVTSDAPLIFLVDYLEGPNRTFRPVFRVERLYGGGHFCYTVTPWQAGGDGLEVVS